ncbi:phage tail assembly chaperone [Sandaracinobacter neustonicus]|uniref:Phage tail assembly chaperone n=1 Tax=Sandaracinobacter neustonicus TaxID=1715348 RepID=A0A501XD57_9SPHN|nr:phage tail assembly chaperone [Sandaracinobacter neustonicus]TPE58520.1 phage tail assembly chaperone [Sandaracinobacter neustonicus]
MQLFADLARRAALVATGQLGWSPDEFWRSTAAELALAIEGRAGPGEPAPLDRRELERMQRGASDGR